MRLCDTSLLGSSLLSACLKMGRCACRCRGRDWADRITNYHNGGKVSLEAVVQGRLPAVHYSERVPGCSQTAYVLVYHARR